MQDIITQKVPLFPFEVYPHLPLSQGTTDLLSFIANSFCLL
jgi:hypothetical protein